jgi:uncharacterized protein
MSSSIGATPLPLVWKGTMPRAAQALPLTVCHATDQGLYKLVLVVAEACNLRCTYCYAEGGPYGRDVSVMTPDTARRAVREMFTRHRPIQTLQYFGGEPSLNLAAMQAAADEVLTMVREGELTAAPRLSIVTNGAHLTDELLHFYKSRDVLITVSHDGPQDVQDALRPNSTGGGTFGNVDQTLARFRDAGIRFDIQCTYTRKHILAGYRVPDLVTWFHERGGQLIHIVPVSVPEGSDLDVWFTDGFDDMVEGFREAVRMTFHALDEGRPLRFGMVQEAMQLLRRDRHESKHYCNAGVTTLTVAANGEVYPCFMFINKHGFVMGRVGEGHHLGAFARRPEHGTDYGCPGREFMMSGQIRPFHRDDALKRAVLDEVLTCLDERLTRVEAELGVCL